MCSIHNCANQTIYSCTSCHLHLCSAHIKYSDRPLPLTATDNLTDLDRDLLTRHARDLGYRDVDVCHIASCDVNEKTIPFLPASLALATSNYENDDYSYDSGKKELSFKLLETNPYKEQLQQVYSLSIHEDQLSDEMLSVIKQYTGNHYLKTNLNLLSNCDIDWNYTNKLRSIIRGLYQLDLRSVYYRGLHLSDTEVNYFKQKMGTCYYTNSFSSFTTEKELAFGGNALIILNTTKGNRLNIANVWKWSIYPQEMEAILSIAAQLKILNVYQEDDRCIIEVQLVGNE